MKNQTESPKSKTRDHIKTNKKPSSASAASKVKQTKTQKTKVRNQNLKHLETKTKTEKMIPSRQDQRLHS